MFLEAADIPAGESLCADIAVVGAGPAGLALALELAGKGRSVLLLESGGMQPDAMGDALNAGTSNLADYPFERSRARAFGGATTRWFGACVPLDDADFSARPSVPHSGWPIGPADVAKDIAAARAFFGLPQRSGFEDSLAHHPFATGGLAVKPVLFAAPNDMGQAHRRAVKQAEGIRCVLGASVTHLTQSATASEISGLVVRRPDGTAFEVTARSYVLATGGLEAPRLLLASRDQAPGGVGNSHDVVGRYHMEHPIRSVGVLSLSRAGLRTQDFTEIRAHGAVRAQATLGLTPEVRRDHALLDLHARAYRFHPLEADPAVVAAKALIGIAAHGGRNQRFSAGFFMRGLGKIVRYSAWHYSHKLVPRLRPDHLRLLAFVEQEPDPENRITLSDRKDRFGTPLPHLAYFESNSMLQSIAKTVEIMDATVRAARIGTLQYDPKTLSSLGGHNNYGLHPLGSTRMSDDPRTGVVNSDLKVHEVSNLYIVSSSVFPTGGAANPTLSVVALALRLARHLATLDSK